MRCPNIGSCGLRLVHTPPRPRNPFHSFVPVSQNVSADSKAILFNSVAIAVNQDPKGHMGIRLTDDMPTQVWAKTLTPSSGMTSKAAVGLCENLQRSEPAPTPPPLTFVTV